MLIGEIFITEGKAYAHHYSDTGYKVVDETGTEYEEVTDEVPHNHTYEESRNKRSTPDLEERVNAIEENINGIETAAKAALDA